MEGNNPVPGNSAVSLVPQTVQQKTKIPDSLSESRIFNVFGEPAGTRTQDPQIKSLLLYQLSYRFSHALRR